VVSSGSKTLAGTVHVEAARTLVAGASLFGMAPPRVIEHFGLDRYALHDLDARVPMEVVGRMWMELPELLEAPSFGLDLAAASERLPMPFAARLVAASATLGEGLARLRRFERVLHDVETTLLEEREQAVHIVFDTRGGVPLPRHTIEFAWAFWVVLARRVTGSQVSPQAVQFTHPAPESTLRHRELFGVEPTFGALDNRLVYAPEDLARPCLGADPGLGELLEHWARAQLEKLPPREPFIAEVHDAVARAFVAGDVTLAEVAAQMGLGERTLQRRLREHGLRFADVLDQVRRAIALERLSGPDVSLAETAFALGFSDQTSFHRAFVRWTGTSPGRYRQRLPNKPD
jgi:AraC-like DNA-binding protein